MLALCGGLLAAVVGLRGAYVRWAAAHWRGRLAAVSEQRAAPLLRQVAELGEPGMALLAESLGSCGAAFSSPPGHSVVGLEINANHLRSVKDGWVTGVGRPFHAGRTTQVWHIEIRNERGQLTCVSRITLAVLQPQT